MHTAIVTAFLLCSVSASHAAGWQISRGPAAQQSAQICANKQTQEAFVCLHVRCEPSRKIGIYFEIGGGGILPDEFTLRAEQQFIKVAVSKPGMTPFGFGQQITRTEDAVLNLLRTGHNMRLTGSDLPAGYDAFTLRGTDSLDRAVAGCRTFESAPTAVTAASAPVLPLPSTPPALRNWSDLPGGKPKDIFGLYPGMSYADAAPFIKAYGTGRSVERLSDINDVGPYPWFIAGGVNAAYQVTNGFFAWFSGPSTGQQLLQIERVTEFTGDQQPDLNQTIKSLSDKYGPPQFVRKDASGFPYNLRWIYVDGQDRDGCSGTDPIIQDVFLALYDRSYRRLGEQGAPRTMNEALMDYYRQSVANKACGVFTWVTLKVGSAPDRISSIQQKMIDLPRVAAVWTEGQRAIAAKRDFDEQFRRSQPKAGAPRL